MERVQLNPTEQASMLVQPGDLLFARQSLVLSGAGKCSIVIEADEPTTFESHLIRVRLDPSVADAAFYHYYFKSPSSGMSAIVTQGVQAGIRGSDLRRLPVRVPPLATQQRIAAVLAAYDDLIENNRRRIALLEQSARLLYREWFVYLRFPGHEHARLIDGLPEGWTNGSAFDAMEVLSGGTPKTDIADYWGGDIPFFTPKDASDTPYVLETEKSLTETGLGACNSPLYPAGTLFITARGTVGNLSIAQVPMAMNQSCYALRGRGHISQVFLYCALREAVAQFKSRAGGAVFDAIVINTFKLIPFMQPPAHLVQAFTQFAEPAFRQIDRLLLQSKKLREARDLLLPRLMSGQIKV